MKRIYSLLFLLIAFTAFSYSQIYVDNQGNVHDQRATNSQYQKKVKTTSPSKHSFDKRKLEFGGSLGLQFGNYTVVNISPQVGYRFTNKLSLGAGIGYSYYNDDRYNQDYTEHFASFNLYGTFYPVSFLVLSVSPEISRMWQKQKVGDYSDSYSTFVPSVVVGGGVRIGQMMAQIKYDVVQDKYSPYGNGIFYSVGYTFGF